MEIQRLKQKRSENKASQEIQLETPARSDSSLAQSKLISNTSIRATADTHDVQFVAPTPIESHGSQRSTDVTLSLPSMETFDALATPNEEKEGFNPWTHYDETKDYQEHNSWAKVRGKGFRSKMKFIAYKTVDGFDYAGGIIAGIFGLEGSQHQYVIDAVEQMEYEERMEEEELQGGQLRNLEAQEDALEQGYSTTSTSSSMPAHFMAPGAPKPSTSSASVGYV